MLIESKSVLSIPWNSDPKARLVKSFSSISPHTVVTDSKNKKMYICDDKCQMFKGFSLCSHVIATAESNGDLQIFLDTITKTCQPNLTAIATAGMPAGTSRKGGLPKRKRKA